MNQKQHIHDIKVYDPSSANEVLSFVFKLFDPKTVVDAGCGIGTWLSVARNLGAQKILGIDSLYADRKELVIDTAAFIQQDLTNPDFSSFTERYDLVISLEVAEHLPEYAADNFVKFLTHLGDKIIFSAAIPNQGGQGHLNEQWPSYWQEKFKNRGYSFYDIFRFKFWNNPKVDWWYKQNTFLIVKDNVMVPFEKNTGKLLNFVHPDLYIHRSSNIKKIKKKYLLNSSNINDDLLIDEFSLRDAFRILWITFKKRFSKYHGKRKTSSNTSGIKMAFDE